MIKIRSRSKLSLADDRGTNSWCGYGDGIHCYGAMRYCAAHDWRAGSACGRYSGGANMTEIGYCAKLSSTDGRGTKSWCDASDGIHYAELHGTASHMIGGLAVHAGGAVAGPI